MQPPWAAHGFAGAFAVKLLRRSPNKPPALPVAYLTWRCWRQVRLRFTAPDRVESAGTPEMRADRNGRKVTFAPSGGRLRRCAALKPVPILNLVSLANHFVSANTMVDGTTLFPSLFSLIMDFPIAKG